MSTKTHDQYRNDIDGLRAIAVLSVVLYHTGINDFFTGGFVGVDIFFVISGFLITSLIEKDIAASRFSLAQFYERRVRRIFPAVFTLLVAVFVAAYVLYDADTLTDIGYSVIASATSTANIYFYTTTSYFNASPLLKPLIHLWSLAIEEQFYIVLPLLLLFLSRFSTNSKRWVLAGLFMISLAADQWVLTNNASAAFYFPHLRAWELLAGSLLATVPFQLSRRVSEFTSISGLALITIAIFAYTEKSVFPGVLALLPVLGSAMVIAAGSHNNPYGNRLLQNPILVFFGKISYSLYLWHWPIFAFCKYYFITPIPAPQAIVIFAVTIGISTLSWWFIETPFRDRSKFSRNILFTGAAILSVMLVFAGSLVVSANGYPQRFQKYADVIASMPAHLDDDYTECTYKDLTKFSNRPQLNFCKLSNSTQPANALLWGDSHARALIPAFQKISTSGTANIVAISHSGCLPYELYSGNVTSVSCEAFNEAILKYLSSDPNITTIILTARWTKDSPEVVKAGLDELIGRITTMGKQVVLIGPVPEYPVALHSAYFVAATTDRKIEDLIELKTKAWQKKVADHLTLLAQFASSAEPSVHFVDLTPMFCKPEGTCTYILNGNLLYYDTDHLSQFGAESIADPLAQAIFTP